MLCAMVLLVPGKGSGQEGAQSEDWIHVGDTPSTRFEFRPRGLRRSSDGIVTVWIRASIHPEQRETIRKRMLAGRPAGGPTNGVERFAYYMELNEYDCNRSRSRPLTGTSYDEDGRPLSTETPDSSRWLHILPDSIGESLLEAVCGYHV
jgi:hypothetical protein